MPRLLYASENTGYQASDGTQRRGMCAGLTMEWVRNVVLAGPQSPAGHPPTREAAQATQEAWKTGRSIEAALSRSEIFLGPELEFNSMAHALEHIKGAETGLHFLDLRWTDESGHLHGHMVGLAKRGDADYHYFEPNRGLFLCESYDDLRSALRQNLPRGHFDNARVQFYSVNDRLLQADAPEGPRHQPIKLPPSPAPQRRAWQTNQLLYSNAPPRPGLSWAPQGYPRGHDVAQPAHGATQPHSVAPAPAAIGPQTRGQPFYPYPIPVVPPAAVEPPTRGPAFHPYPPRHPVPVPVVLVHQQPMGVGPMFPYPTPVPSAPWPRPSQQDPAPERSPKRCCP
jgi:hypothetical protein